MLSIKKNHRFREIYATAPSRADRYLVMYRADSPDGVSHLGITVSGKIGHAVVRNRIRRRVREIVRLHDEEFIPGCDIVVVARKPAAQADYAVLSNSVMKLASSLGLIAGGKDE